MTPTQGAYDELTGVYGVGSPAGESSDLSECREEPNATGKKVGIDGILSDFSSMVYLPLSAPDFNAGDIIRVYNEDSSLRFEGVVKRFSRGQLSLRIWA